MTRAYSALFLSALLGLAGCGSSSNNGSDGGGGGGGGGNGSDGGMTDTTPITNLPSQQWSWVDFPAAKCRNGTATGIAVNVNPGATKLIINLMGGGACFNTLTCGNNPDHFGKAEFDAGKNSLMVGILDRANAANPVKDWNMVFVPYCTGDVHAGNNPHGMVDGLLQEQQFVGYANMGLFLKRLVPTFANATNVILTGESAGGFGALANYVQVARAFDKVPVDMLDDSGPPMAAPYLATCLQKQQTMLWALDKTLQSDCGASCMSATDPFLAYLQNIGKVYPERQLGLIESVGDATIRGFFGFGSNNCMPPPAPVSEADFTKGLDDIRMKMKSDAKFGAFYFAGDATERTAHTTLLTDKFTTRVAGTPPVKLIDWVTAFVNGTITNVGP